MGERRKSKHFSISIAHCACETHCGAGCVYSYRSGGSGCASQNVLVHAQNSVGWSSIAVSANKKKKKKK